MRNTVDLDKLKEMFETGKKFTRDEIAQQFGVGVSALSQCFNILESRNPIVIRKEREPNETKFKFFMEKPINDKNN